MKYQKKAAFVLFAWKSTEIKQNRNVVEMNTKKTISF